MSLLIGENMVVSMHYTLTNDQGTVIDKSEEAEPLTYLHGAGNIILDPLASGDGIATAQSLNWSFSNSNADLMAVSSFMTPPLSVRGFGRPEWAASCVGSSG